MTSHDYDDDELDLELPPSSVRADGQPVEDKSPISTHRAPDSPASTHPPLVSKHASLDDLDDEWTGLPQNGKGKTETAALKVDAVPSGGYDDEDEPLPSPQNMLTKEPESNCVLMGPAKVGKTTLLGGICQACLRPPRSPSDHRLKLIAGEDIDRLLDKAHETLITGNTTIDATSAVKDYRFTVRVTRRGSLWRPERHKEALLLVRDGPGGALFPVAADRVSPNAALQQWERQLLQEARRATALVLCVDASDPQLGLLSALLPRLIAQISTRDLADRRSDGISLPLQWGRRGWPGRDTLRQRAEQVERWVRVERFLLLLTKVDCLVNVPVPPDAPVHRMLGRHGRLSKQALASAIDPVQQACQLLGMGFLYQIQSALKPGARFAVGITSTWGFEPESGEPLVSGWGTTKRVRTADGEQILKDWQPFGVRDAIIFMLTGEATGCVQLVHEDSLCEDSQFQHFAVSGQQVAPLVFRNNLA